MSRATISFREIYKSDPEYDEFLHTVQGLQIFVNDKDLKAICFSGKRTKHTWFHRYNTIEQMYEHIDKKIKVQFDKNIEKIKMRAEKKKVGVINRAKINVGDVFYDSWGYDQTNCDFYIITAKLSCTKIKYRAIGAISVEHSEQYMSGKVKPNVNDFISEEQTGTLNHLGNIAKCGQFGHSASKTVPNESHYVSWGR